MCALFRVLKSMIEKGKTDGIEEKIDVFYAANILTTEEYNMLIDMLHKS